LGIIIDKDYVLDPTCKWPHLWKSKASGLLSSCSPIY